MTFHGQSESLPRAAALPDRNDGLTEDRLLGGRVRLTQPAAGYREFCPNASEFDRLLRGAPEHES